MGEMSRNGLDRRIWQAIDEAHGTGVPDPGWYDRGLCSQTDPDAFFPGKGGSTRMAKLVCRCCEVRAECLEYALETNQGYGVWGGMSERERRRMLREQGAA